MELVKVGLMVGARNIVVAPLEKGEMIHCGQLNPTGYTPKNGAIFNFTNEEIANGEMQKKLDLLKEIKVIKYLTATHNTMVALIAKDKLEELLCW